MNSYTLFLESKGMAGLSPSVVDRNKSACLSVQRTVSVCDHKRRPVSFINLEMFVFRLTKNSVASWGMGQFRRVSVCNCKQISTSATDAHFHHPVKLSLYLSFQIYLMTLSVTHILYWRKKGCSWHPSVQIVLSVLGTMCQSYTFQLSLGIQKK